MQDLKGILVYRKSVKAIGNRKLLSNNSHAEMVGICRVMNNSSLDSTKQQSLGWEGLFCAERGFGQTIEILRSLE